MTALPPVDVPAIEAVEAGGGGAPSGPAGGVLSGTYPNPSLAVDRVRIAGDTMTGGLVIDQAAAATVGVSMLVTGDAANRYQVTQAGSMSWGGGAAAVDITLSRSSARSLALTGVGGAPTVALVDGNGTSSVLTKSSDNDLATVGPFTAFGDVVDDFNKSIQINSQFGFQQVLMKQGVASGYVELIMDEADGHLDIQNAFPYTLLHTVDGTKAINLLAYTPAIQILGGGTTSTLGGGTNGFTMDKPLSINSAVISTVEKLGVNAYTTADTLANVILSASATTAKPLVVQGVASQTASLFEAQDSTGAIVARVTAAGAILSGSTPSTGGQIRIPNNTAIAARNQANSGNINLVESGTADQVTVGTGSSSVIVPVLVTAQAAVTVATTLSVGTSPSASGTERLPNAGTINFRNAANSADIAGVKVTSSDVVQLAAAVTTNDATAAVSIGTTGTAKKGLVVQSVASQTAALISAQISTGVEILSLTPTTLTFGDAVDIAFNATTGTKIGTATTQKLAFWNKAPIVQPTNAIAAAAFVANTSLIANDTATFGGYTLGQIAAALIATGILT